MKASRILCVCAAVVLPQLAAAEDHDRHGQVNISAQGLGTVDALLNYCSQVDPRDAALFQAERNVLNGSSDAVEGLRGSSAYRDSYDMTSDALKGVSRSEGAQSCAAFARS